MDIQKEIDRLKFDIEEHKAIIQVSKDMITADKRKIRKLEVILTEVVGLVKREEFDSATGKMVHKVGDDTVESSVLTAIEQRQIEESNDSGSNRVWVW